MAMEKHLLSIREFESETGALRGRLWSEIEELKPGTLPDERFEIRAYVDEVHKTARALEVEIQLDVVIESMWTAFSQSESPSGRKNLRGGRGYALYLASCEAERHDGSVGGFLKFLCRREAEKLRGLYVFEEITETIEDPGSRTVEEILNNLECPPASSVMWRWLLDAVLTKVPADPDSRDEVHTLIRNIRRAFREDWNIIQDHWWRPLQKSALPDTIAWDDVDLAIVVRDSRARLDLESQEVLDLHRYFYMIDEWFNDKPPFLDRLCDVNGDLVQADPPTWWNEFYQVDIGARRKFQEEFIERVGRRNFRTPRSRRDKEYLAINQAILSALIARVFPPVQDSSTGSPKELE